MVFCSWLCCRHVAGVVGNCLRRGWSPGGAIGVSGLQHGQQKQAWGKLPHFFRKSTLPRGNARFLKRTIVELEPTPRTRQSRRRKKQYKQNNNNNNNNNNNDDDDDDDNNNNNNNSNSNSNSNSNNNNNNNSSSSSSSSSSSNNKTTNNAKQIPTKRKKQTSSENKSAPQKWLPCVKELPVHWPNGSFFVAAPWQPRRFRLVVRLLFAWDGAGFSLFGSSCFPSSKNTWLWLQKCTKAAPW